MGRPAREFSPDVLTREDCETLARRVLDLVSEPQAQVTVGSGVSASVEFARGDTHMVSDGGGVAASITVKGASVSTTRLDDAGLTAAVTEAEAAAQALPGRELPWNPLGPQDYATPPKLFYDSVEWAMTPEARAALVNQALDATEAAGLVGAGSLNFSASSRLLLNTAGLFAYDHGTYGEFSFTARTKDGTGSGWAWSGHEDWRRVEPAAVIARAVELAERSAHPVAVEPGRYTVILEPAAVAALILGINWLAEYADRGYTVFSKEPRGTNKTGLQMLDERVGIVADPWDPEMPQSTVGNWGDPLRKVIWFDHGVLQDLWYTRRYAREKDREPVFPTQGIRLAVEGSTQTLEEMIASTRRGIWVNRLSGSAPMNQRTELRTGTTRDGTFLIENGRITKPIKNFRFNESPFFVLNKLEAWGEPVRASRLVVAPRLKVRDFNMTSLTDAI